MPFRGTGEQDRFLGMQAILSIAFANTNPRC